MLSSLSHHLALGGKYARQDSLVISLLFFFFFFETIGKEKLEVVFSCHLVACVSDLRQQFVDPGLRESK